jgi:Sigma-70 region 2
MRRAEELVHDALVRAYEHRSNFRLGGNLRTWLLSILHFLVASTPALYVPIFQTPLKWVVMPMPLEDRR